MNKLWRGVVLVGVVGLILAVMALLGARSGSRGALRKYKAELRAKGEKLTFAELTRERLTNVVDSHAVITNAAETFRNARLNPGLLEVRKYVRPGQATVTWRQNTPAWQNTAASGSGGTWEELDRQMQAAQSTLGEVRAALKEPAADAGPSTNMLFRPRHNFVAIRTAAQWLMGAAENDLHQGRLENALQNLEALAALARMERDEYTLGAQMIRIAVAGLGLAVTWEVLQAPGWSEPQLERLQRAWEPVDLLEAVEKGLVGDRVAVHEMFTLLRRSRGRQTGDLWRECLTGASRPTRRSFQDVVMDCLYLPAYKLTSIDEDELFYLRTTQESIRPLRSLKAPRPWAEAKHEMSEATARLHKVAGSLGRFRHVISAMAIPNCSRAGERAVHVEAERQMAMAAIALKRFELRHGKLPPSLEALVPELLTAVPHDYLSAKPLGYRLQADGSYLLYSVGDDGKDDGGDPAPPPAKLPGLWEGRDAVWPSPATESGETP